MLLFQFVPPSPIPPGFPGSSAGKELTCNAGDPGSISGLGRSTGEGIGYRLQYSWAFLMAQLLKNLPAMWETLVRSLGAEDPCRRERLPIPVFWPEEFQGLNTAHGVAKSQTGLSHFHFSPTPPPAESTSLLYMSALPSK